MKTIKYQVQDLGQKTQTNIKTEKELREWGNKLRINEKLKDVVPNFTEIDLNGKYYDDIDSCIEFIEGYEWEITEIKN